LDGILVALQDGVHAVVLHFFFLNDRQRIVDEDERRLPLRQLGLQPVQLLFSQRASGGMIVGVALFPGIAQKIIEVDKFPAAVLQAVIGRQAQLAAEQLVRPLARHVGIVVVAEAHVYRHPEAVGQRLGPVDPGLVLEIKVHVGGGVIVKIITHQEHFLHPRRQGIDQTARRFEALRGLENRLRILGVALRPLVIAVDDVRVGNDGEIELRTVGCGERERTNQHGRGARSTHAQKFLSAETRHGTHR
jgi:hypothetical protein